MTMLAAGVCGSLAMSLSWLPPIPRKCGRIRKSFCSTPTGGRPLSPAFPPITSAPRASFGAIRFTIGPFCEAPATAGGSTAFGAAIGQVDVVRLDHFRAFAAAWHIPAGSLTARIGEWRPGPGADFFQAAAKELGPLPVIAEDLGLITADVTALRDQFHFPGMRVLQFAFDGDPENQFLPENYPMHVVAYTATHDNNTSRGWYESLPEEERQDLQTYLGHSIEEAGEISWDLIRLAWESRADLAIAPLQDVLNLGAEARMNWPGHALGNWGWRATEEQVSEAALEPLAELTRKTGRSLSN